MFRKQLFDEGVLEEDEAKKIDQDAKAQADASASFADSSPYPDKAELLEDIYWHCDQGDSSAGSGIHFFETP